MSAFQVRFGTDGIRGVAGSELTADLALQIGRAAGKVLAECGVGRPAFLVGRDPRASGEMLSAALCAGLASAGCSAADSGVLPTPAVSWLVSQTEFAAGFIVSASHNPFHDNGIKIVGPEGRKLGEETERRIEARIEDSSRNLASGKSVGRIGAYPEGVERYLAALRELAGNALEGLRLVLDCANGATSFLAPQLFRSLGCDVRLIHGKPDGFNINDGCGSTRPEAICETVRTQGADAGLAFDGDGDRVILCDETGGLVDGDRILAVCALNRKQRGKLEPEIVVATIMSNAGLELALEAEGIRLLRTDVGDKYVAEAMRTTGAPLGGEQSGHILFTGLSPTGDGMLTGIQVLRAMRDAGRPLSEMMAVVQSVPQTLRSVRVASRERWKQTPGLEEAIEGFRRRLGRDDWLSVRASGTEPLVRVMVQHPDADLVEEAVCSLCKLIASHAGAAA